MSSPLYGIANSNRTGNHHLGKNEFNSSFPVAMACYMRDNYIPAVYLKLKEDLKIEATSIDIDEVFNCHGINGKDLYFEFESKFQPYSQYSTDGIDNIDLIIKEGSQQIYLRALEIKLTVIPDNTTHSKNPELWAPEIVFRPVTTKYCALGIADAFSSDQSVIKKHFEKLGLSIIDWGNKNEMYRRIPEIVETIDSFEINHYRKQKPLIMQPIWRTKGKSPHLEEHAFDIFIWSDYAFTRLFLDNSVINTSSGKEIEITRQMRSTLRLARFLYEYGRAGNVQLQQIYTNMAFGLQTDKEFASAGNITYKYMNCDRLRKPILKSEVITKIIPEDKLKELSPERRFDQTLYFTIAK